MLFALLLFDLFLVIINLLYLSYNKSGFYSHLVLILVTFAMVCPSLQIISLLFIITGFVDKKYP